MKDEIRRYLEKSDTLAEGKAFVAAIKTSIKQQDFPEN